MYDDDNYDDGFDEEALAAHINTGLWRKLFAYARGYPGELRWLAIFAVITALMEVAFPLLTKGVIDDVDRYLKGGADPQLLRWGLAYVACTATIALAIGGYSFARQERPTLPGQQRGAEGVPPGQRGALLAALRAARRRVVVKRPLRAAALGAASGAPAPSGSVVGTTTRYDLYAPQVGPT